MIAGYWTEKGSGIGGGSTIQTVPYLRAISLVTDSFIVKGKRKEVYQWLEDHKNLPVSSITNEIFVWTGHLQETNAGKILMQAYATNLVTGGDLAGPVLNTIGGTVVGEVVDRLSTPKNFAFVFSTKKPIIKNHKTAFSTKDGPISLGQIMTQVGSIPKFDPTPPGPDIREQFKQSSTRIGTPTISEQFEQSSTRIETPTISEQFNLSTTRIGDL